MVSTSEDCDVNDGWARGVDAPLFIDRSATVFSLSEGASLWSKINKYSQMLYSYHKHLKVGWPVQWRKQE